MADDRAQQSAASHPLDEVLVRYGGYIKSDPKKVKQMFHGEPNESYKSDPARTRHPPYYPEGTEPGQLAGIKHWTAADVISVMIMIPMGMIMPLLAAPLFMASSYSVFCERPMQTIPRTAGFFCLKVLMFPFLLPVLLLLFFWGYFVWFLVMILCFPYVVFTCRFGIVYRNFALISASGYLGFVSFSYDQLVAGLIGSVDRQGFSEYWLRYGWTVFLTPLMKYVLVTNVWTMRLDVLYFNQWTPALDDNKQDRFDDATLAGAIAALPSRALHDYRRRSTIDEQIFSVYYQMPQLEKFRKEVKLDGGKLHTRIYNPRDFEDGDVTEGDRKTMQQSMLGIQTPLSSQFPYCIPLATRTVTKVFNGDARTSARSPLSKWAIYAVHLHYFNPYHHFTGLVEVNLTHQDEVEHPAWVIADGGGSIISPQIADLSNYFFRYGKQAAQLVEQLALQFQEKGFDAENCPESNFRQKSSAPQTASTAAGSGNKILPQ